MTTTLDIDRATLASMRIESALMPPLERRALHLAEAHQRRIDRVLELHTPGHDGCCRECGGTYPCHTAVRLGITE